ncbi:MAG: hypothetical protein ACXVH3_34405, partial [Solirubrobacteraceae bacterium]
IDKEQPARRFSFLRLSGHEEAMGLAAALCESGSIPPNGLGVGFGSDQSSRPALTCIIGARLLRIVPMISSTSIPCR